MTAPVLLSVQEMPSTEGPPQSAFKHPYKIIYSFKTRLFDIIKRIQFNDIIARYNSISSLSEAQKCNHQIVIIHQRGLEPCQTVPCCFKLVVPYCHQGSGWFCFLWCSRPPLELTESAGRTIPPVFWPQGTSPSTFFLERTVALWPFPAVQCEFAMSHK